MLRLKELVNCFEYNMSVEQVHHAVCTCSMGVRMGNHYDSCSLGMKLFEQLHHLFAVG